MKKVVMKYVGMIVLCAGIIMVGGAFNTSHACLALPYQFSINGSDYTGDFTFDPYTDHFSIYNYLPIVLTPQITIPADSFSFILKWDPYLKYSLTFNNPTGVAQSIGSMTFTGNINMVYPSNVVSTTMAQSTASATQISELGMYDNNFTLLWVNAGVDVQPGNSSGPITGPAGLWTFARITLDNITVPDGQSTLEGDFKVNAVPIPSAIWLFIPALAGLVGLRRRSER
jgi:hypothetical protein